MILSLSIEKTRKSSTNDKKALLTERVSWPDGKLGGAREMGEVPPRPPRMMEDPGNTIVINEGAT